MSSRLRLATDITPPPRLVWSGCAATVGIEGVTPHTLRHAFASVAGDLGFSELTIRALLGHGSQSVTQDYIHIDEALKLATARTCEEIASLLDKGELARAAASPKKAA
ncbi:MAG TPA: tyrosine-type recombinase/integrase [Roseiarcus sp.]|jgi:site-specific recombinase XerD